RRAFTRFVCHDAPRALRPCPTRRSSDLHVQRAAGQRESGGGGGDQPERRARRRRGHGRYSFPRSISRSTAGCRQSRTSSPAARRDRKSTRLNSSHVKSSYAVFCLKKEKY